RHGASPEAADGFLPIPVPRAVRDGVEEGREFRPRRADLDAVAELLPRVVPEELDRAEAGVHAELEAERLETRALRGGIRDGDSDVIDPLAVSGGPRADEFRR